jgi:hypothetical protein
MGIDNITLNLSKKYQIEVISHSNSEIQLRFPIDVYSRESLLRIIDDLINVGVVK